jgi:hypothetical protein
MTGPSIVTITIAERPESYQVVDSVPRRMTMMTVIGKNESMTEIM